jgi:hypothetical protein
MNLRERTLHHAAKAAAAAAEVEEFQRRAKATIRARQARPGINRLLKNMDVDYAAAKLLKDHWPYAMAVDNRNGHQTAAVAYGIAALVEALGPVEATED